MGSFPEAEIDPKALVGVVPSVFLVFFIPSFGDCNHPQHKQHFYTSVL